MFFNLFVLLTIFFTTVSGDRILLLVDDLQITKTHSIFLDSIRNNGHNIKVSMADDASLKLIEYGEFIYDHLILFSPSVEGFYYFFYYLFKF